MATYVVSALYKFVTLTDFENIRAPLLQWMKENDVFGTLLLAHEGINGTVAGSASAIDGLYQWLARYPALTRISHTESYTDKRPFHRTKVKLKKEIVTLGVEGVDPTQVVGTYVKPQAWNQLIASDDVLVIDTRNDYEVKIGAFKRAINPNTSSFREFPDFVKNHLESQKDKKIAMYCTGGIRCEKSTAYLKQLGFKDVYHLEGGILKYLEDVPAAESLWEGECFVFDDRVAVNHDLRPGHYDQCHACRYPITPEDKHSPDYLHGVSCPQCVSQHTDEQKQRFAEREKQNQLALARGEQHIGGAVAEQINQRRLEKYARI